MLTSSPHRLRFQRQDHPLSADDERPRDSARAAHGQDGGVDRHLEGARRAARSPDRDVQPEEAGAGDGRVLGSGGAGRDRRRQDAGRRRRLQERRRARPRPPRVRRSGGPASVGLDRSGARRAGDGRRADPGRPRRRRASARAARKGSEEKPVGRSRTRARRARPSAARRSRTAGRCARSICKATI